jgi:hypothetical protein
MVSTWSGRTPSAASAAVTRLKSGPKTVPQPASSSQWRAPRRIRKALTGSGDGPSPERPAPVNRARPAGLSAAGIMRGFSGNSPSRRGVTVKAPTL